MPTQAETCHRRRPFLSPIRAVSGCGDWKKRRWGAGLERELTARSLNVKEQRNYRNLIPMQLDEVIFPMLTNQSSTGLILKLKTLVSKFNRAVCSGKGHHSGHHGGPLKAG